MNEYFAALRNLKTEGKIKTFILFVILSFSGGLVQEAVDISGSNYWYLAALPILIVGLLVHFKILEEQAP